MNTNRTRCDQAFESNLRVQAVVDLASMHATDAFEGSLDRPVEDLIDDLLEKERKHHPSTVELRKVVQEANEDTIGILGELLYHRNLLGLAVQFATPVMTRTSKTSWSFSWGYYQTEWIYAESYDEAWKLGLAWSEKCRAESKKAEKPAPKRRRKPAAGVSA